MVDYHVDRPEVEALQGVELTGTNSSEVLTNYTQRSRDTWEFFSIQLCKFSGAIGSSSGSPSRRGSSFWRPWRRGSTRSHPEHGS